jgi:1-acyl-sn-glycerol-3-phosphate acyltransferase
MNNPKANYFIIFFRLIYKIWLVIVFFATGIIQYPFYYLFVKLRWTKAIFVLQSWFWLPLLHLFLFIRIKRIQPKNFRFPDGPFIIVANHTSYMDIVLLHSVIRDRPFIFLGKAELKKFPLIGIFFRTGTLHIAVDRKNRTNAANALKKMGERLDEGYPVVIFPEGTQSKHAPELLPFKSGAFKLALEKKVPIITITFCDNWKILSNPEKLQGRARPGISRIVIHNPVETIGIEESESLPLQNKIRQIILEDLNNCGYKISG